ncbi:MAG: bifunctional DNA-binding transcriptional regulator/O6-methylguanine-DNA methyltransferase Ada [Sinimarinibacterium sp.]|jgi:AraC family transcriptional regulator of adaptative response/methylated-DNA-[protein]-cysteine methyltransferase
MNEQQYWSALEARDASQDGTFFYGVVTTGVYCRPSCRSRLPLRSNVRFYSTAAEAERDGLRPCKRCRPLAASADEDTVRKIRELCRHIEAHSSEVLSLQTLARQIHLSPHHLQRTFKAVLGVTPREYVEACRMAALKRGLRGDGAVADAIYNAGFGSASRVYERVKTRLGMTPKQYRAGAAGVQMSYGVSETPLGLLMIGATDRGLCFVQFGASEAEMRTRLEAEYPGAAISKMDARADAPFAMWMAMLREHLSGLRVSLDIPVDLRGTAFQMTVWNYLLKIPYGEVQSYSEVAAAIGKPKAVRAVASACAANRVALLVPCHRVIRGDGGLGGYRWGIERKRVLIDRERAVRAGTT